MSKTNERLFPHLALMDQHGNLVAAEPFLVSWGQDFNEEPRSALANIMDEVNTYMSEVIKSDAPRAVKALRCTMEAAQDE